MQEKTKNITHKLSLVILFIVSLIVFFYFTFPYGVLKENLVNKINSKTGMNIYIGTLKPSLPLGVELQNVEVSAKQGGAIFKLRNISINIGILNLLIGNIGIDMDVVEKSGGSLDLYSKISIFNLIKNNFIPSVVNLKLHDYAIGNLVSFLLDIVQKKGENDINFQLISSMLSKLEVLGKLKGKVDFKLNSSNPTKSTGLIDIKLNHGILLLNDPSLKIEDQKFKKANIKANLNKGSLVFTSSEILSQEIDVILSGKIDLKPMIMASVLDLRLNVFISGNLLSQFSLVLNYLKSPDGKIRRKILGSINSPIITEL